MTDSMPELASPRGARDTAAAPERSGAERSGSGLAMDVRLTPVASAMELVTGELTQVEERLGELLHSTFAIIPRVGGHLTFAGGKRFRPMATLLAAQAAGFESADRITVAAAAELLHTATLLHDDVIDEGEFRRGRQSARLRYGNGLAVLTGDYCYARALQAVAYLDEPIAIRTMADAVTRMAEGEVAQLHVAGEWDLDRERYYMVIERKTAALISWCSAVGHLVDPAYAKGLAAYGREVGYAFQIADDIIDYSLDLDASGKARGQDLREGKATLPLISACHADPSLHPRLQALLRAGPPVDEGQLAGLIDAVIYAGGLDAARAQAQSHVEAAVTSLSVLPPSPARQALEDLVRYIVRRTES